jgi:hypothetical protein
MSEGGETLIAPAGLARIMPVTQTLTFQTVEGFETKARAACQRWMPDLAGQRFHVRMHTAAVSKGV